MSKYFVFIVGTYDLMQVHKLSGIAGHIAFIFMNYDRQRVQDIFLHCFCSASEHSVWAASTCC